MSDRFQLVSRLFEEARSLPAEDRAEYLAQQCGDDAQLRSEVEELLALDEQRDALSDTALRGVRERLSLVAGSAGSPESGALPQRIGDYQIVRRIGMGGMGVVFEALQESPRRSVALKLLHPTLLVSSVQRRFEREAELLGRLRHPGIAQVYATGTSDRGFGLQPWFAMELIDGRPLTRYAEEEELDLRQRLELIAAVCEAVHHAHTQGIVHRDLKPDNVLVEPDGRPRIVDFGIAHSLDADDPAATLRTAAGELLGTLAYMAPEQVSGQVTGEGSTHAPTVDVYALGVLTYELLAGRLPHELAGRTLTEAVRVISEQDTRPLREVAPDVPQDVALVVQKALEHEPARRYGSAAELRDDLGRFLRSEPILAREPSTWYQLGRFARRNRLLVGSAATVFGLTLAAVVALTWSTLRARAAEADAELRYAESEALGGFYDGVLQTTRTLGRGPDVTVLEVVDEMAVRIEEDLADRPLVRARVLYTLGKVYRDLSRSTDAAAALERSYAIRERELGPDAPETHLTAIELGMSLKAAGQSERALEMLSVSLASLEAEEGPTANTTLAVLIEIANLLDDDPQRLAEAQAVYTDAIARLETADRLESSAGLTALANSGLLELRLGNHTLAEQRLRRAIGLQSEPGESQSMQLTNARANLGQLLLDTGRLDEAEVELRAAYTTLRDDFGPSFIGTSMAADKLGQLCTRTGDFAEADELFRYGIANLTEYLGPGHRYTLRLEQHRAALRLAEGRPAEALALADGALAAARAEQGERSQWVGRLQLQRAKALRALGRDAEAEAAFAEGLPILEEALGADSAEVREARTAFAATH